MAFLKAEYLHHILPFVPSHRSPKLEEADASPSFASQGSTTRGILRAMSTLPANPMTTIERLAFAREVLDIEAQAIQALAARLDDTFVRAVDALLACRGKVVVSGIGKSGHVARKIASTLASTGTPAFFVHAAEASHGDLGMVAREDVLLILSNSGENPELLAILPLLKRRGSRLIALTGNADSTLGREADICLNAAVSREACPLNLAPTASTTAALALGDALAVTLLSLRGFGAEDFAHTHPGGALGRRLLVRVADVMHTGERLPQVLPDTLLPDALLEMTRKGLGLTAITDEAGHLLGIYTDGDLRRTLDRPLDLRQTPIRTVMTASPRTIAPQRLAAEAVEIMERHAISGLLVTDGPCLVGALNMHDLLRAGVV